jgi:hypothetical protein
MRAFGGSPCSHAGHARSMLSHAGHARSML